jgi:hypothetical protein
VPVEQMFAKGADDGGASQVHDASHDVADASVWPRLNVHWMGDGWSREMRLIRWIQEVRTMDRY